MTAQELRRSDVRVSLLTGPQHLDRLLAIMASWWDGWSRARIAREHGISRQRVAALLAGVGCTRELWNTADHERPDSPHRSARPQVARAREALLHPLACRLTVRQRAALAWQAQGLVLVDIARRMRTSPQNVRNLQVAGRWRLERLSAPRRRKTGDPVSPENDRTLCIDWGNLLGTGS